MYYKTIETKPFFFSHHAKKNAPGARPTMASFFLDESLVLPIRACPVFQRLVASHEDLNLGELAVYNALRTHRWRTRNASAAILFYIPLWEYTSYRTGHCQNTTHVSRMNAFASALTSSEHWRRHEGADHFFITTAYSWGDRSLDRRLGRALVAALRHTIVGRYKSRMPLASSVAHKVFAVPYPTHVGSADVDRPRIRLLYFGGTLDVCCTGRSIRCELTQLAHASDVLLVPTRRYAPGHLGSCSARYENATHQAIRYVTSDLVRSDIRLMQTSVFCLTPAGDNCVSGRFYNALANGCIPVAICPGGRISPAFETRVPYAQMVVMEDGASFVKNASALLIRLHAFSADAIRKMQLAIRAHAHGIVYDRAAADNVLLEAARLLTTRDPAVGRRNVSLRQSEMSSSLPVSRIARISPTA